jgi:hypothetical protein
VNAYSQKALHINLPGDYVDIPYSPSLAPIQFTIELWIRVTDLQSSDFAEGEQTLLDNREGNSGGYNIRLTGTKFPLGVALSCDPNYTGIENVIPKNTWCHIAFTRDSTSSNIYLNGRVVANNGYEYSNATSMPLRIGETFGYPDQYYGFHGDIDELRIWNYPKTESQISESMCKSLSGIESGLMAYWNFDEDTLPIVKDKSSKGNNGIAIGNVHLIDVTKPEEFHKNFIIDNDFLKIQFDPYTPAILSVKSKSNGDSLAGAVSNEMLYAQLCHNNELYNVTPLTDSVIKTAHGIKYRMRTEFDTIVAATFDLSYIVDKNTVTLIFDNVSERANYKLIFVKSTDLVTVRDDQPGARMIFPEFEGRLIEVKKAAPGYTEINPDYTGWRCPLQAGMIYSDSLSCIANYKNLDQTLWFRVFQLSGRDEKNGAMGMTFYYHYAPSDFSKATIVDVFDSITTSLSINLTFLSDFDKDGDNDWMDGAKYLRSQISVTPHERYLKSFIGKMGVNGIGPVYDHLSTIKKLYNLTDHNKTYLYLLDYGPLFELFGLESDIKPEWPLNDLIHVFDEAAESYNTILSFHDNYTDYYPGTPGYDPSLRIIQEDGIPSPGYKLDNFPNAFFTDYYDYAVKYGINRVKSTIARYPVKDTYHIDVLSVRFPKDHSPESPSSRERNRRGVNRIVDEFEKNNIDVTSEELTGQYAESAMGFFIDVPRYTGTYLPFGNEEVIPFMEFIYHGKTLYGLFEDIYWDVLSPPQIEINKYLEPLLSGANSFVHINWQSPNDLEIEKFYLVDLPWMLLNQRFMEDYQETENYRRITYDNDTYVEIDYQQNSYTVQVDGKVVAKDYTTIYPKSDSTFLIYSKSEKDISIKLPNEWNIHALKLIELNETGKPENIQFTTVNNSLAFHAQAYTPYKLFMDNFQTSMDNVYNFKLCNSYPNPFSQTTFIEYDVPFNTHVKIEIYNVQGQKVRTLLDGEVPAGHRTIRFNGENDSGYKLSCGIYFCTMSTDKYTDVKKLILSE